MDTDWGKEPVVGFCHTPATNYGTMTPSVKIVTADADTIPIIRDIACRTWPTAYGDILTPGQIAYMLDAMYSERTLLKQMEQGRHRFLLAELDAAPVGYLGYELDADAAGITRIHKLYALPAVHGRGVGRALLDAVIAIVEPLGQERLRLNVNRYNPSVRFYERQGFEKIGQEDIDIGSGYYMNDFIMELQIAPPEARTAPFR
jgi:GNAT superfamily N-acetyltransferase